jgi:hypothetical protein
MSTLSQGPGDPDYVDGSDIDWGDEGFDNWAIDPRDQDDPIELDDPGFDGYDAAEDFDDWAVNPAREFD